MILFSKAKLEHYVGDDIMEQLLVEWEGSANKPITKKDLADMVLSLSGISVLKINEFRKDLLMHMDQKEIDYIYGFSASEKVEISVMDKVETISNQTWKPSDMNNRLLQILHISENVFDNSPKDDKVIYFHESMSRFYELLDYQYIIKQRILNELEKNNELTRMLVHMPTGTGKTKTMMHTLIHYYIFDLNQKGLVIWLAHTTELLQQAYDTFEQVWKRLGNGVIKSYKVWGNKNVDEEELEGIMFCGIQKLQAIKRSKPEIFDAIVKSARLIVFDEAHKATASETRSLIESMMVKKEGMVDRALIGLTATPGRTTLTSDENVFFTNMFERRIIRIDTDAVAKMNYSDVEYLNQNSTNNIIEFFQNKQILSKIKKEQLYYEENFTEEEIARINVSMTENGYKDFSKATLAMIGRNRSRNKSIMKKLRELSIEGKPTIVFACSVAHVKLLSYMLTLENIPNAKVLGEMNSLDRENAICAFKDRNNPINILINYEVLTTGFDSTNIQCVFITRPTQSIVLYSQMLGRGLRGPKMGGNEECLLIDIKDNLGKYDADMAFEHFDSYWYSK